MVTVKPAREPVKEHKPLVKAGFEYSG